MAKRAYVQKHRNSYDLPEAREIAEQDAESQNAAHVPAERTDETDALLDEIDSVLEENAEQFVKDYVQKGGQ